MFLKAFVMAAIGGAFLCAGGSVNRSGYSDESNVVALKLSLRGEDVSSGEGLMARDRTWEASLGTSLYTSVCNFGLLLILR